MQHVSSPHGRRNFKDTNPLKVHTTQAWDNFEFIFLPKSNPYMPFVNFGKQIRFFSFDFHQNFDVEHFRGDWAYAEPNFFWEISKKFFSFKIFTMVLLDGFLDGFSKFLFFIVKICVLIRDFLVIFENYCMRMLSILGNDFIACWAY